MILCTYPESNFAEAMMSGVPVVLLYDARVSVSQALAQPLIVLLRRAKIIFDDPGEAARHIDSFWARPEEWWESEEVVRAREHFASLQLVAEVGPMSSWTGMLLGEVEDSINGVRA